MYQPQNTGLPGGDGAADVALGQGGTGAAYILEDNTPSPLAIWDDARKRQDSKAVARAAAKKAQAKAAADKNKELNDLQAKAWDKDVVGTIAPAINNYYKKIGEWGMAGYDPNDPASPIFAEAQAMEQQLKLMMISSAQHKSWDEQLAKDYNSKEANFYDPDSLAVRDEWTKTELMQRMGLTAPTLTGNLDLNKHMLENITKLPTQQTSKAYAAGDTYREEDREFQTYPALRSLAKNDLQNPVVKKKLQREYDALPEDQKKAFPSLEDYTFEKYKTMRKDHVDKNIAANGNYYQGLDWQNQQNATKYILQLSAGLQDGDPKLFGGDLFHYGPDGKLNSTESFSQAFKGKKLGQFQYQVPVRTGAGKIAKDANGNPIYELKSEPNQIDGFRQKDGKLYIKDTRAQHERNEDGTKKYSDGYRPLNDMASEFFMPFLSENFGEAQGAKMWGQIETELRKNNISLQGGSADDEPLTDTYGKKKKAASFGKDEGAPKQNSGGQQKKPKRKWGDVK